MTGETESKISYATYGMLGGSLLLGLFITVFGVYEPSILSNDMIWFPDGTGYILGDNHKWSGLSDNYNITLRYEP